MKRIFLACFLLTATCTATFVQQASAYAAPAAVTQAAFQTKIDLMDTQIGSGDITAARATWEDVHQMMLTVLATTKASIHGAATPTDKATYEGIMTNQYSLYQVIWGLKPDLAANRVTIHGKLVEFKSTIY